MLVYVILHDRSSVDHRLGDSNECFVRREDAERFIEEVRCDELELIVGLRNATRGTRMPIVREVPETATQPLRRERS
jgi:hypothetical protein